MSSKKQQNTTNTNAAPPKRLIFHQSLAEASAKALGIGLLVTAAFIYNSLIDLYYAYGSSLAFYVISAVIVLAIGLLLTVQIYIILDRQTSTIAKKIAFFSYSYTKKIANFADIDDICISDYMVRRGRASEEKFAGYILSLDTRFDTEINLKIYDKNKLASLNNAVRRLSMLIPVKVISMGQYADDKNLSDKDYQDKLDSEDAANFKQVLLVLVVIALASGLFFLWAQTDPTYPK